MTTELDLYLLVEAYYWLKQHPEHFDMRYFVAGWEYDEDAAGSILIPTNHTPVVPECGTTFCLAGTILLLQARKEGKKKLYLSTLNSSGTGGVFQLLEKHNPDWAGWETSQSDRLYKMLYELFTGDWHKETMNTMIGDITLPQLWQGIQHICIEFDYVPVKEF